MSAKNKCVHVFYRDVEFFGQEVLEACRVEHTSHAHDFVRWKARELAQRPNHCIKWVGDADNKGVWRMLANAFTNLLHDFQVNAQKIVTAHARLTWHTSGHNNDISTFDVAVGACTLQRCIKTVNR